MPTTEQLTEESSDQLIEMYRRMLLIREFETAASRLYRAGQVPGFVHLSIGQEATAVGACWSLRESDGITSTHRGHGHCIAKGMDIRAMFAELMGRETGSCKGRGGSMHIADPSKGVFGANGIVGAGLPIAVGVATASQILERDSVTVCFFGDGAVGQGMFHEAVNLAAVWRTPVVFLCENNHYSEFSRAESQTRGTIKDRARGYGVGYRSVDGNDVVAVARLMDAVVEEVRAGSGPLIVECDTYRWHGHYEGDPQLYRDEMEIEEAKTRDPLVIAEGRLSALGVPNEALDSLRVGVMEQIQEAIAAAESDPLPDPARLHDFVVSPGVVVAEPPVPAGESIKMFQAIRRAVHREMTDDPRVYVAGIDVGEGGNVFALFRGLLDEFPGRVLDTPISEAAILGSAVGAAMAGARPVVELMYMDFIGCGMDALLNQASKMRYMTGGGVEVPLVVRTQFGAGRSSGSQHSQSLEAMIAHVPGLTVVMPSNPADAYGLLRASIQSPNPVVFVENRLMYGSKGPAAPDDYLVPLGKARVAREGLDVTVVSWSRMLNDVLEASQVLSSEGISIEVIDLRTISPVDTETILASVAKTNRLVIAHESVTDFGVGAEIAAVASSEGFWTLDAPIVRIAPPATPVPYSPPLERAWLPDVERITNGIRKAATA